MPELLPVLLGVGGQFDLPGYARALVTDILNNLSRVYLNTHQSEEDRSEQSRWDFDRPISEQFPLEVACVRSRPTNWSYLDRPSDTIVFVSDLPNLEFAGVRIWWYKHSRRGLTSDAQRNRDEWIDWYESVMAALYSADRL
jgi:hypothetical protein